MDQLQGTQYVESWVKRKDAGNLLTPPVGDRQLRKYLKLASLYLPSFQQFRDKEQGGLNRYARLSQWHIPTLQRIRTYARDYGMKKLRIQLSHNPQYFEELT